MQNIIGIIIYLICSVSGIALGISLIVKGDHIVSIVIGCSFVVLSYCMAFAAYKELEERRKQ